MATWEDGPEYAPAARPDAFSPAEAPPIEAVLPESAVEGASAGTRPGPATGVIPPVERPDFSGPEAQLAPLAALIPAVEDPRDPALPFAVATSTLTSMDSAWGAAHGNVVHASYPAADPSSSALSPPPILPPAPSYPALTGGLPSAGLPPTTLPAGLNPADPGQAPAPAFPPPAPAWPAPTAPVPPLSGPARLPAGYPPPGTPGWFGPGSPAPQPPPAPAPLDARALFNAATPGLCIVLLVGGFLPALAPVTLGVAFALSLRVRVVQEQVRAVFMIALGFLGLLSLASLVLGESLWFTDWWGFVGRTACLLSWLVLAATLGLVYRALRSGSPRPPSSGYPPSWS